MTHPHATEHHRTYRFLTRAPLAEPPLPPDGPQPRTAGPRQARESRVAPRGPSHAGCSPARRTPPPGADPQARRFTEAALRLVLEVLDHRRQPPQLRAVLTPAMVDVVAALARRTRTGPRPGAATLQRLHLHPTGPDAAEVFGTYARGGRVLAIAGRVERAPGGAEGRAGWRITALQVG